MDNYKKIFFVMWRNIINCLTQPRFYVALILVGCLMNQVIYPIKMFSAKVNIPVCPWIFPFLTQVFYLQMIMILGIVFIFCDVPIINNGTVYILVRTGKKIWFWAQVGYILVMTFIYYLCILLVSIILFFPHVTWGNQWGKVLGTLAQTDLGIQIEIEGLDYLLQVTYKPLHAIGRAFFIAWLVGVFVGIVILVLNTYFKSIIGAIMGTMIAFTPYFAWNAHDISAAHYISPGVWMNIMNSYQLDRVDYPNALYIFTFLIGGSVFLIGVAYLRMRNKKMSLL